MTFQAHQQPAKPHSDPMTVPANKAEVCRRLLTPPVGDSAQAQALDEGVDFFSIQGALARERLASA